MLLAVPVCHLVIQPKATETRRAAEWMLHELTQKKVPESEVSRLDICLAEVLANVLSHAGLNPEQDTIDLSLDVQVDGALAQATLAVRDPGTAFDPTAAKPRPRATSLADAVPGGLGLVMMRSNADDIQYRREGAHNLLTLTVQWAPSSDAG